MIEVGYERDSFSPGDPIRWWVFVAVQGRRNQRARQGVIDRGFHFARGGRCAEPYQAESLIRQAREQAESELHRWEHQPSHALGPGGELIALDEVQAWKDAEVDRLLDSVPTPERAGPPIQADAAKRLESLSDAGEGGKDV